MSCSYPSCMMGGGSCPYEAECDREANERVKAFVEQNRLDKEEQIARTKFYKSKSDADFWRGECEKLKEACENDARAHEIQDLDDGFCRRALRAHEASLRARE